MSKPKTNWYEELGRAIAEEAGLSEGSTIEHQCGTVWVTSCGYNGETIAISGMKTETEDEVA
jgi:hypothetical protein